MIDFNTSFFLQVLNFLILILILHFILFKPVLTNMGKRDGMIKSIREDTEKLSKEVNTLVDAYNSSIANAKKGSADIINRAKGEASAEQDIVISNAKEKFKIMVDEAKVQIQAETEKVSSKLEKEVRLASRLLARRILGREIN